MFHCTEKEHWRYDSKENKVATRQCRGRQKRGEKFKETDMAK